MSEVPIYIGVECRWWGREEGGKGEGGGGEGPTPDPSKSRAPPGTKTLRKDTLKKPETLNPLKSLKRKILTPFSFTLNTVLPSDPLRRTLPEYQPK